MAKIIVTNQDDNFATPEVDAVLSDAENREDAIWGCSLEDTTVEYMESIQDDPAADFVIENEVREEPRCKSSM